MKNYFAYVNGGDVFVNKKLIEKTIAKGMVRGCASITLIGGAIATLGYAGCYLASKFCQTNKHSTGAESDVVDETF